MDVICDLVRNQRKWSTYVDKIWQKQYQLSSDFPFVEESINTPHDYSATSSNRRSVHLITLVDDTLGGIPSCNCDHFASCRIPCAGICAVFSRLTRNLFTITTLHHRWRLDGHPLYRKSLLKMKLIPSDQLQVGPAEVLREEVQSQIDISAYEGIVCPKRRDVRYTRLNNLFKTIEPLACKNEHNYKLLTLNLNSFKSSMEAQDDAGTNFLLPTPSLQSKDAPPARVLTGDGLAVPVKAPVRRGRTAGEDVNR